MEQAIRTVLQQLGQKHLLEGIEHLSALELQSFLAQLQKYDRSLVEKLKTLVLNPQTAAHAEALPWQHFETSGSDEDRARGEALLRQGKVGCLILAGGQGTRLGMNGPKGAIPITPLTGKSLFQLFCERTKEASRQAGCSLPLCIMTSELNHAQTLAFFAQHSCFGLGSAHLDFFSQEMLPFLDDCGNWLLEKPGKVAEGPDGNGHALRLFFDKGIWSKWHEMGIEYLNVIFVDNALADPFDPEFIGFAARTGVDAALKAVERHSPDEKMGVLAKRNDKLKVIEYSEMPSDSSLYTLSSTSMFCLPMSFIHRLCQDIQAEFPLHLARKKANVFHGSVDIWKCERFLFDLLDYVASSAVLVCPRERTYAPLKNATGDKSLATVQKALQQCESELFH